MPIHLEMEWAIGNLLRRVTHSSRRSQRHRRRSPAGCWAFYRIICETILKLLVDRRWLPTHDRLHQMIRLDVAARHSSAIGLFDQEGFSSLDSSGRTERMFGSCHCARRAAGFMQNLCRNAAQQPEDVLLIAMSGVCITWELEELLTEARANGHPM